jgi:hypothetical protein
VIPHLGIYLKECQENTIELVAHTFIASLFTKVKLWEKFRFSTTDE